MNALIFTPEALIGLIAIAAITFNLLFDALTKAPA